MEAKNEEKISTQFEMLRSGLNLTNEVTAKILLLDVEEVEKIKEQQNSEISTKALYALHYFGSVILENPNKDDMVYQIAGKLKKACVNEQKARIGK